LLILLAPKADFRGFTADAGIGATKGWAMKMSAQELVVEELYFRHHTALRGFLRRLLRCDDAAADVAQDAYLRLLRLAPRTAPDNPRAYLFQVAANAARDRMAGEQRRNLVVDGGALLETAACPKPDAEAAAMARNRLRILAAAVEDLPPRCREVFLMSRLDGLRNGEIAARLGISRNMVEKHIIKAMLHCRKRLDALSE
jgi:RNA polymerase sigma factor (sigma-70 family)